MHDTDPLFCADDRRDLRALATESDDTITSAEILRCEMVARRNGTRMAVAHVRVATGFGQAHRLLIAFATPGGEWRRATSLRRSVEIEALSEVVGDILDAIADARSAREARRD